MALIETPHDYEVTLDGVEGLLDEKEDRVTWAIWGLQEAVVEAFKQHDRDLRSEVERVNRLITTLIWVIAVTGLACGTILLTR